MEQGKHMHRETTTYNLQTPIIIFRRLAIISQSSARTAIEFGFGYRKGACEGGRRFALLIQVHGQGRVETGTIRMKLSSVCEEESLGWNEFGCLDAKGG